MVVTLMAMTVAIAPLGHAQTALTCSPSTVSMGLNQSATFTASGGNGSYVWSGQNLVVNNPTGNQFTVSYPAAGSYTITVASAGLTANCTMNVGTVANGTLSCMPATQTVVAGQNATFTASGGNGNYVWTSPDLSINNPTGSGFTASFAGTGSKSVMVSSAGQTATCYTTVVAASGGTVTPGLPNTGGGYGHW